MMFDDRIVQSNLAITGNRCFALVSNRYYRRTMKIHFKPDPP
jgi:hypothetical protein